MIGTDDLEWLRPLNIDALREVWRDRFGEPPPPLRSGDLMRRALAERIQQAGEGVDAGLDRRLALTAARHRTGRRAVVRTVTFKTGSRLERAWQGQRHQVEVVEGGFIWEGRPYRSLSQVARAITGVRWNGPRFFGLREDLP